MGPSPSAGGRLSRGHPGAPGDLGRRRAHLPRETAGILEARTLANAHRRLAALLVPGQRVLDVGCGTGAITRGIAEAVAPKGRAVGVDLNAELIERARSAHGRIPGLAFALADACRLPFRDAFDVVTAARVLQWLTRPADAVREMAAAVAPGGLVVVLDFDHTRIAWEPAPPPSMQRFYAGFLGWRAEAGMDNAIADGLPALLRAAGLADVAVSPQHEVTRRGEEEFDNRILVWAQVAASRGHQMVADGVITEAERSAAECDHRAWARQAAREQRLYLLAVQGRRPWA